MLIDLNENYTTVFVRKFAFSFRLFWRYCDRACLFVCLFVCSTVTLVVNSRKVSPDFHVIY